MRSSWISRIWGRKTDGGAPIWPTKARDYVEYKQEKAYRDLGDRLGDGSCPQAIYERLMSGRGASEKQTPEEVRDELKLGDKFSPEHWEQVKRRIKEVEETPRNFPAPTRYEDQRMYKLMNEIRLIIIERAAKVGCPIKFPPFLATLPSGDVNAQIAFPPESKQPVLFFEQGLVWFLLNFAALASWVVPIVPPEDLSDRTLANIRPQYNDCTEQVAIFASSLSSYIADGNPLATKAILGPRPQNAFLNEILFMRMMMFVLVHEFKHLELGHLARKDTSKDAMWNCEYEADIAATTFVTQILGGWGLSFWACDLALIAFNLLDRALGAIEFGDNKLAWISQTHPEPIARRNALFGYVGVGVPIEERAAGGNLFAMDQALFQRVWELIAPGFVEAHLAGSRPSPIWSEKIARSLALVGQRGS
jgi:hypothetical protein